MNMPLLSHHVIAMWTLILVLFFQLPALDKAKVDLLGAYALNSLFWGKECNF